MSYARASASEPMKGSEAECEHQPTAGAARLHPSVTFGLRAAALAGLVVVTSPVGAAAAHHAPTTASLALSASDIPNITCCGGQ